MEQQEPGEAAVASNDDHNQNFVTEQRFFPVSSRCHVEFPSICRPTGSEMHPSTGLKCLLCTLTGQSISYEIQLLASTNSVEVRGQRSEWGDQKVGGELLRTLAQVIFQVSY